MMVLLNMCIKYTFSKVLLHFKICLYYVQPLRIFFMKFSYMSQSFHHVNGYGERRIVQILFSHFLIRKFWRYCDEKLTMVNFSRPILFNHRYRHMLLRSRIVYILLVHCLFAPSLKFVIDTAKRSKLFL